jgi:hypothetical protein
MMPQQEHEIIIPRYKLIVTYDVIPSAQERYFRFLMSDVIPMLQEQGIYMTEAWHTAYGSYPLRMAGFVSEELENINDVLDSEGWAELEQEMLSYVRNYSLRVVPYRQGFQFFRPS